MDALNLTTQTIREERYDAILHMVTAANGAEQHYNSHEGRFESTVEARQRDELLKLAYRGHPNQIIIDNKCDSFDDKVSKAQ